MVREHASHLDADLCLDLILGELPAGETQRWGEHLLHCPACEERVRVASAELETRRAGPVPRRDERGHWSLPPRSRPVRAASLRQLRWAVPAAAMVAAAVVACLLLWPGQKANETASTPFWIERNLDEIAPRSGASSQATLQQGLRAYEHHDAARAVELLEKAAGEEGMDEIRRLYLASALLHVGRADESIRLLDELEPMTLPPPWRGDALWTLHAALLQNGRSTAADSLLEQMADIPGKTGQRARELRMH